MDRGWYFRFVLVMSLVVWAFLALWPSFDEWAPAPSWVKETFAGRISPGLDIQGGLRLMYEVDVEDAVRNRRDRLAEDLLPAVGELIGVLDEDEAGDPSEEDLARVRERVRISTPRGDNADEAPQTRRMRLTFERDEDAAKLERDWLRDGRFRELALLSGQRSKVVSLGIRDDDADKMMTEAVEQAVKAIENRIDELAIREMTVIGRDTDIIIEIPGGDDTSRVVSSIVVLANALEADDEGRIVLEVTTAEIASSTGVTERGVEDVFGRLAEIQLSSDGEGEPSPLIVRDGDRLVIHDLDAFRDQSTFEKVRDIISRQAVLEFRVLADDEPFMASLSDMPEGIEATRETTTIKGGRQANPAYLTARGEGSRQRLLDYIATVDVPDGREILISALQADLENEAEAGWRTYFLRSVTEVTGEHVTDAYVGTDEQGRPVVQLEFSGDGATKFGDMTGENVKARMAIVLDNRVESAPVIQERIGGGRCQITLGSYQDYDALNREAAELVVVLKAGALPADISPSNEQLIGPTLGRDSVERGAQGALVGIGLVLVFMLLYYQVAGIVADVMVVLNIVFLLAALAIMEATLTLPGVAGIALTVGMAVDANVLITERIREELRLGKSPRAAVDQGFRRAFWSIFDAQLTTFIAGVVLYQYGTGPIRGFAVTLMIGIASSLFTGVFCSKVFLDWIVRGLRVQRLRVG